jgi:hypothetical protein
MPMAVGFNANLPIAYFPDCARAYPGYLCGVRRQVDFLALTARFNT